MKFIYRREICPIISSTAMFVLEQQPVDKNLIESAFHNTMKILEALEWISIKAGKQADNKRQTILNMN